MSFIWLVIGVGIIGLNWSGVYGPVHALEVMVGVCLVLSAIARLERKLVGIALIFATIENRRKS